MSCICIHQPDFAPHLGFFHRLMIADHFLLLDDVQFIRRGWQHRDRIKGRNGPVWLTLSVKKGDYHQLIRDVILSTDDDWIEGNLNLLRESYRKAAFFDEVFADVERIYRGGHVRMIDLNLAFLAYAMRMLEISIPTSFASSHPISSTSSQRLVDLVRVVGGDEYLTGSGSRDYLDESLFAKHGLRLTWQSFQHPVYPQLHGTFLPMLSCLDLFFNCGPRSAGVLREAVCV